MSQSSSKFGSFWMSASWVDIKEESLIFHQIKKNTVRRDIISIRGSIGAWSIFDDSYWLEIDWIKINLHIKSDKILNHISDLY